MSLKYLWILALPVTIPDHVHKFFIFIWYLFGVQGGKDLENRVNWVDLCSVCSSEKVGDVVLRMVADILPDLLQLRVPNSRWVLRVPGPLDSSSRSMLEGPFESGRVRVRVSLDTPWVSGLILSERLPSSAAEDDWLKFKAWNLKGKIHVIECTYNF